MTTLSIISTSILAGEPLTQTLARIAADAEERQVREHRLAEQSAWDRAWEAGRITWIDDMPVFTG